MADSVKRPGIEISQVISETPVTPVTPTLVPCVVGPCYEVMEALVDGVPNLSARIGGLPYNQFPLNISSSDFPTNNTTTDELVFDPSTVDVTLVKESGSNTKIIPLDESKPGSAFLTTINIATRPALAFNYSRIVLNGGVTLGAVYMKINNDLPVKVSFGGGESAEEFAEKFSNKGFDVKVHTVLDGDPIYRTDAYGNSQVMVMVALPDNSACYGADASISILRQGDLTQNDAMHKLLIDQASAFDVRVEGSGLQVSSTDSSVITLKKGTLYAGNFRDSGGYSDDSIDFAWSNADGVVSDNNANYICTPALLKPDAYDNFLDPTYVYYRSNLSGNHHLANNYGIEGATPRSDGDLLFLDGVQVGQLSNITESSMRVQLVDTGVSRYAEDGAIIYQRYTPASLAGTKPRSAYVKAQNLGTTSATNATNTYDLGNSGDYNAGSSATVTLKNFLLDNDSNVGTDPALMLQDTQLLVRVDTDGVHGPVQSVVFEKNYDGTDGIADLQAKLNDALTGITAAVAATQIELKTTGYGSSYTLTVLSALEGSSATSVFRVSAANDAAYLANDVSVTDTGTDATVSTFGGETLHIYYDGNPEPVVINIEDNVIKNLAQQINDAVFFPSADWDPVSGNLTIKSGLKGAPSIISVLDPNSNISEFAAVTTLGIGRPLPELTIGLNGSINITGQILRSQLTGEPIAWNNVGSVSIYVSYKALRLDVTTNPTNGDPGLIKVSSLTQLINSFAPLTPDNPLGLGLYYALVNAGLDGTEVAAIGVSDVTDAEPEGTLIAYQQALELLQAHEIYAIAPLTSSESVISVFDAHVSSLSSPENRAERVLISSPLVPTREESTVVASGTGAQSVGILNTIQLDEGHADELGAYIDALANPIPFSDAAYIEININGVIHNYSLESLSGSNVKVRIAIPYADNIDGFFSVSPIMTSDNFEGSTYSIFIRGNELTIPGTSLLDSTRLSETVRNTARQYSNRRQLRLFPDQVASVIEGIETIIPSYFFASAIAGDCASRPAQDPLTRNSLVGFSNVIGPDLSDSKLDVVAAGNAVIHVQASGEDPVIRMQCTTDADALENREFSIVKALDQFAKTLRSALRDRIGRFNITQDYLDNIGLIVGTVCSDAVSEGLLANADPTKIEQDSVQRDTLIVEVAVAVLYPANYIKLTIVV